MAGKKRYSDEVRAQAMAALLAGQGIDAVAREFNIDKSTASRWRKKAFDNVVDKDKPASASYDLDKLLYEYVGETLNTLSVQARHFGDKEWLGKQSAAEIAVLHGVQADKALRILEAVERAFARADAERGGGAGG